MKKRLVFVAVITIFFVSCTGFYDLRDQTRIIDQSEKDENGQVISTTKIYFDNTWNKFPVDVFSTHTRTIKVSSVQANAVSDIVSWLPTRPNEDFYFYLTFYLPIEGIQLPFIPRSWGADTSSMSIPFNTTTQIPIVNISTSGIIPDDALMIDDVCIILENSFSMTVQFQRGNVVLKPENQSNNTINYGQKGLFRIPPANTNAGYQIRSGGQEYFYNLPSDITSLARGNVYIIEVASNGHPLLKDSYPLTMNRF